MSNKQMKCPDCKFAGRETVLLRAYVFRPKPTRLSSLKKEMIGYWCEECGMLVEP